MYHHVKDHVEIDHLTKYDAFRVNGDQVIDLEIWLKTHTILRKRPPKPYNCCRASVASKQQHKKDLRRIYRRGNEFSKSSLFTRLLCGFLPDCFVASTRVHCAMNNTGLCHCCDDVLLLRGLRLRQVSGYGLLWFTCKAMWARSCLAFATLVVVVNAEFESLEIWTINCDVLI